MKENYYKWDIAKSFFIGAAFPIRATIAMLLLIKVFEGSEQHKHFFPSIIDFGMLLIIPAIMAFSKFSYKINRILPILFTLSGSLIIIASFIGEASTYIISISLSFICLQLTIPVSTQIYSGYDKSTRGRYFSYSTIASILGGLFFGFLSHQIISTDLNHYKILLRILGSSYFIAAVLSTKLPSDKIEKPSHTGIWMGIKILKNDKLFSYISAAWFLIGFANLWIMPFRTNLLVEAEFGFAYSPATVVFLTAIIPSLAQLISTPIWGHLFDNVNFITLRIWMVVFFIFYIAAFFIGQSYWLHILGMILFGIAIGGGHIAWNLWVTKIAKKNDVPSYMSVHSSLTGLRMVGAPLLGYSLLITKGPTFCAIVSMLLLALSIIMLIPMIKFGKTRFNN